MGTNIITMPSSPEKVFIPSIATNIMLIDISSHLLANHNNVRTEKSTFLLQKEGHYIYSLYFNDYMIDKILFKNIDNGNTIPLFEKEM